MEGLLRKLMEMVAKNDKYDPWIESVNIDQAISNLEEEIEELKEALEKDEIESVVEELGDMIWTAMLVLLVARRSYGVDLKQVIGNLEGKMRARKPYIFDGYKPSLEVARRIWKEAKERGE